MFKYHGNSGPCPLTPTSEMEALSNDLYDYFVLGGGHSCDDTSIAIIAAHAPAPAVRDADVDRLVKAAEIVAGWEHVMNPGAWVELRAAIARVKGKRAALAAKGGTK